MQTNGGLTERQLNAISDIERACSILSLIGCIFTITTFCCSRSFHKPINRLVFYASFGNMMTNVATLISRTYIDSPNSGPCQFQGFLVQMFMPADAFWTLAMAFNVYLSFYHKYDAQKLRTMEVPYLVLCYGIPFVPAFTYIWVKNRNGQRAYGNATLWCWVSSEWDIWRILTFYGPVWVSILVTLSIYACAGRTIYERRKQLSQAQQSSEHEISVINTIRTTEVTVSPEGRLDIEAYQMNSARPRSYLLQDSQRLGSQYYSVHISSDLGEPSGVTPPPEAVPARYQAVYTPTIIKQQPNQQLHNLRRRNQELNNAAWAYTKCSMLFFTAILITWIPSSANRVYSIVHHQKIYPPLEIMSAFVLPLQGFWNACIYVLTSWSACQTLLEDLRLGRRPEVTELVGGMRSEQYATPTPGQKPSHRFSHFTVGSSCPRSDDSESTAELSKSQSSTGRLTP